MQTTFPVGDLIRDDHREMRRLFTELESRQSRPLAAPMLLALLAAHSRAEESEVYPALRRDTDAVDAVAHSQHEHAEADRLVEELVREDLDDAGFDRTPSSHLLRQSTITSRKKKSRSSLRRTSFRSNNSMPSVRLSPPQGQPCSHPSPIH